MDVGYEIKLSFSYSANASLLASYYGPHQQVWNSVFAIMTDAVSFLGPLKFIFIHLVDRLEYPVYARW